MVNIICHRGLFNNVDIVENTIPAFKRALSRGLAIELDIRMTKDNVIVIFHDYNLKRLTGIDRNISDITYQELKEICLLQTNAKIPSFIDVLDLVNGRVPILIEIKEVKNKRYFINQLSRLLAPYQGKILLQSFDPRILVYLSKSSLIRYDRGILITNKYNGIKEKLYNLYIYDCFIKKDYCSFLSVSKSLSNNIKKISNKELYIWTIKTKEEFDKYSQISNNLICEEEAI